MKRDLLGQAHPDWIVASILEEADFPSRYAAK